MTKKSERCRPMWLAVGAFMFALFGCDEAAPEQGSTASLAAPASAGSSPRSPQGERPVAGRNAMAPAQDAATVAYANLLREIVSDEGLVHYERLSEPATADRLRTVIEGFAAAEIPAESAAAKAFLLNAYNVNLIALAAEQRASEGFTTVQAAPGFFDTLTVTVGGRQITLNALEDELRAHKDPRIHGALVRGAMSSAPLRAEPYVADRLDQQLDQQCLAWFDDQSRTRIVRTGLVLSEIFQWREADFDVPPYEGVRGFAFKCSRPNGAVRDFIRAVPEVKIMYMPFDWSLNQAPIADRNDAIVDR